MSKTIPLHGGLVVLVDPEDYEGLNVHTWSVKESSRTLYAHRLVHQNGETKVIPMHREIMGLVGSDGSVEVDHVNGDGLDNRKANLRKCAHKQNMANMRPRIATSHFKGVYWNKEESKWAAQMRVDGRRTHLGLYEDEVAAARAYDKEALFRNGEFAYTNFGREEYDLSQYTGFKRREPSSLFHGVYWLSGRQLWNASIRIDGKNVSLGGFESENQAARKVDSATRYFLSEGAQLNFPLDTPDPFDYEAFRCSRNHRGQAPSSATQGVYWSKARKRWIAESRHDGKRTYLGQFPTEEKAVDAVKAFKAPGGDRS